MTDDAIRQHLDEMFRATIAAHEAFVASRYTELIRAADAIVAALEGGGKVVVFGNGGSAADAQHFAAELVGRYLNERRPLAAIALTTDTSILTAVGNDYEFDHVFARQVEALGRPGDIAVAITTSGTSRNIVSALKAAKGQGLVTIGLLGEKKMGAAEHADIAIHTPAASTPRVQELHRTILHAVCEIVESQLADRGLIPSPEPNP